MNEKMILLGDEAVAVGALHAGASAAYGYPGTPSTEIITYLLDHHEHDLAVNWCANEKTAYETALGTSFAGRRALITMKHVGLNVAADPFMNSALLNLKGGVVIAVADDPGMHSSQNEQDSRFFADFAKIPCLEPVSQQEAYEMTRAAFDISESFHVPVILKLSTRISHSRAAVVPSASRSQNPVEKATDKQNWMLIPALARKRFDHLLSIQKDLLAWSESCPWNRLEQEPASSTAVIATGLGYNYLMENIAFMAERPSVLRVSAYPVPENLIRRVCEDKQRIIVLEEGYPFVERLLRGILPVTVQIAGKMDGSVPLSGELTPDNVRPALGLPAHEGIAADTGALPGRPPQLCAGCPHADTYNAVKEALASLPSGLVTADIGCYALGVLPPYSVPETIVCMGASIGMAKGAAEAGHENCVAIIGDSTFLHSGVTPLIDAVSHNADITVIIVDNETVAMTGGQKTILPSSRLVPVIEGIGVDPAHIKVIEAHRREYENNVKVIREEIGFRGLSVIISVRECIETARKKNREKGRTA
ncbi:MAG: indolepyruvate ferredoxin oxidoreductase [Spirochaetales bacterium]|nr:indolepyruvate ferredoxin oxidoreductase [Spirochaetales bacterium]